MLQLAEKYAKLKGATILSHRIEENYIIFVLSSGGKHTMSTRQLEDAVALENTIDAVKEAIVVLENVTAHEAAVSATAADQPPHDKKPKIKKKGEKSS